MKLDSGKEKNLTLEDENVNLEDKPQLRVIKGGKGPVGTDWLSPLKLDCWFLCRPKNSNEFGLLECQVIENSGKARHLFIRVGDTERFDWVDPKRFSILMERYEILSEGSNE